MLFLGIFFKLVQGILFLAGLNFDSRVCYSHRVYMVQHMDPVTNTSEGFYMCV